LDHLAASRERLLGAVAGLSQEQRAFRPADDRWSVTDCVEHITVVENSILKTMHKVLEGPPDPAKQAELRGKDQIVLEMVPSRGRRVKGPDAVMPRGRWPEFEELMRQFEGARERTVRMATETQADLRSHCFVHPFLGDLDCYQWLLFLATHCERHVRQLEEVKADPTFPHAAAASQETRTASRAGLS
jgi:hypothetical protein